MTSLKSIMERRTMQVLDVRDMKNLKGGGIGIVTDLVDTVTLILDDGGGNPPKDIPGG